jgi:hypothetical protein
MNRNTFLLMGLFSFLIGCVFSNPYQKKKGDWYYDDMLIHLEPGEKLKPLNNRFARSAQHGFYRGSAIDSSDGASFEAIDSHYAKDKASVFYCDTYRKGQEYYFYKHSRTEKIQGADPVSFVYLEQGYAKDNKAVYYESYAFPVKDVASFKVLTYGFTKDRYMAYCDQIPVEGSDGETFTALDSHYAKDKNHVFYCSFKTREPNAPRRMITQIVKGADLATFDAITDTTGKTDAFDKNARYLNGVKLK